MLRENRKDYKKIKNIKQYAYQYNAQHSLRYATQPTLKIQPRLTNIIVAELPF